LGSFNPSDRAFELMAVTRRSNSKNGLLVLLVHVVEGFHDPFKDIGHTLHDRGSVDVEGGEGPVVVGRVVGMVVPSALSEQEAQTQGGNHKRPQTEEEYQGQHVAHYAGDHGSDRTEDPAAGNSGLARARGGGRVGGAIGRQA